MQSLFTDTDPYEISAREAPYYHVESQSGSSEVRSVGMEANSLRVFTQQNDHACTDRQQRLLQRAV